MSKNSRKHEKRAKIVSFYDEIVRVIKYEANPEATYSVKEKVRLLRQTATHIPGVGLLFDVLERQLVLGHSLTELSNELGLSPEELGSRLNKLVRRLRKTISVTGLGGSPLCDYEGLIAHKTVRTVDY